MVLCIKMYIVIMDALILTTNVIVISKIPR